MGAEALAVAFGRSLRHRGLPVPTGSVVTYGAALAAVGLADEAGVYWAGRATLVTNPEDVTVYDEAFAAFWRERLGMKDDDTATVDDHAPVDVSVAVVVEVDPVDGSAAAPLEEEARGQRASGAEVLRVKDFASYTATDFEEAHRLMTGWRLAGSPRHSRRHQPSRRRRGPPDVRATLRAAMRTGGEPVHRRHREPRVRPRRIVLVCDVSGSMEPYARALMRFLHAAVVGRADVEAFAVGTRLTRLTRELSHRDPDAALGRAATAVVDWSGGTRLGLGLKAFNDEWAVRGMGRGAIVVILSDGWDSGDPEVLAEQMARLRRVAHRVVWVNPLKATPGYEPLARGMAAALPHVDSFVEGGDLAAIEKLLEVVSG